MLTPLQTTLRRSVAAVSLCAFDRDLRLSTEQLSRRSSRLSGVCLYQQWRLQHSVGSGFGLSAAGPILYRSASNPTHVAANPDRDEVYVVNTQSGPCPSSMRTRTAWRQPSPFIICLLLLQLSRQGIVLYVTNSGSNSVSVLDVDRRREVAVAGTGEVPGVVRVSPDGRTLVVTNRGSGSVSIFAITPYDPAASPVPAPKLRAAFSGCPGAGDAVILPDSSKVFVACTGGNQVMAVGLAAAPGSWAAKQNSALMTDHLLAFLDVGRAPVHLAMKPDGGEIFVSNSNSDSISEISTWTNEVGGTYVIGSRPVWGIVSGDNGTLWVANYGADSIAIYSIDDGKLVGNVRAGSAPVTLAFSEDEHLLLAADAHSGDVAVIRTAGRGEPALFTIMPAGISPNSIAVKATSEKSLIFGKKV